MEKLLSREELKLIYPKIKVIISDVTHIHIAHTLAVRT